MKAKQVSQLLLTVAKHFPKPSFNIELSGFEQLSLMDYFYNFDSTNPTIIDSKRQMNKLKAHALSYGRGFNKSVLPYVVAAMNEGLTNFPYNHFPKLYPTKKDN